MLRCQSISGSNLIKEMRNEDGSPYNLPIPGSCPLVIATIIFLLLILSLNDGKIYLALSL